MTDSKSNRSPLFVAFFTMYLDLVGFGIIIPVQVFYAESLGAVPAVITLLGASYSLMQFLFAPMWGSLSDRVGRRPIFLSSIFCGMLGHLIFGFSSAFWMLLVARLVAGFGNANIGVVQALVADVTTPETRARGMGVIGAAFGLGFITGPAIGGFLSQWGPQVPAFGAAALSLCNLIMAYFLLPETLKQKKVRKRFRLSELKFQPNPTLLYAIVLVVFLAGSGFAMMEQIIGLFIEHARLVPLGYVGDQLLKAASRMTASYLVAVGLAATVVQGALVGRVVKWLGEVRTAQVGLVILVIALALVPVMINKDTGDWEMYLSGMLLALGSGLVNPTVSALASKAANSDDQGAVLGINQSAASLGRVVGPATAGTFYQLLGGGVFLVASGFLAIAFLASLRFYLPVSKS